MGKQGGGKGREKIHDEQCRTDKTGEDKRRDSQEVQHISWLLLGRQQPRAHTHTHTFLWWWLWLHLHTHFLPVVAHGAYETHNGFGLFMLLDGLQQQLPVMVSCSCRECLRGFSAPKPKQRQPQTEHRGSRSK